MALPTQYAINSRADVTLFFVRPATFEGRKVQMTGYLVSKHNYRYLVKKLTQARKGSECGDLIQKPSEPQITSVGQKCNGHHSSESRDQRCEHEIDYQGQYEHAIWLRKPSYIED